MKKQTLATGHLYRSFLTFSLLLIFTLVSDFGYSQIVTFAAPSISYSGYSASFSQNERLNSDMYNYYETKPGGSVRSGSLFVIVWDDVFGSGSSNLLIIDNNPGASTQAYVSLPAGAIHPDVVIGDDPANPGTDFIVSVVYESGGDIYYVSCGITGAGTGSLNTNLGTPVQISCSGCTSKDPHIDMAGDINGTTVYTQGFNALYDFVIEWSENPGPGWEIRAFKWDLANAFPTPPLSTQFIDYGEMGDVAFSMDIASGPLNQKAHFIYYDPSGSGNVKYADWDPATPSVNTYATLENVVLPMPPRIEATNVIRSSGVGSTNSDLQWMAIAEVDNSGYHEIHTYNQTVGNPVSILNYADNTSVPAVPVNVMDPVAYISYCPLCDPSEGKSPNICVGNGQATAGNTSDIGNYTYTTLFAADNNTCQLIYASSSQDITTYSLAGMYSLPGGWGPFGCFGGNKPSGSVSNGSNDGYGLATASHGDNGYIFYKFCGNTFTFKPTDIKNSVNENNFVIHPNPATDFIFIKGIDDADYTVTDIKGTLLLEGKLSKSNSNITIKELSAGVYILNLTEKDKTQKLKLVKQ